MHNRGGAVHVWTVDTADDIDLCAGLGVEAIITNRPRRVLESLGRLPSARRPSTGLISVDRSGPFRRVHGGQESLSDSPK